MADVELQKAQEAQQAGAELQEKGKDVSKLLSQFGGFNAIRGFMPDADNMNPARKAAKDVFLKDKRFKDKRDNLKREISRWLELLDQDGIDSATGFADACKKEEEKYTNVLKQGITDALYATQNLERSYRQLDSFFRPSLFSLKRLSFRNTSLAALRAGFILSASGMKPRIALKPPNDFSKSFLPSFS